MTPRLPSPRQRVALACARWGDEDVVGRCVRLLELGPVGITGTAAELAMVLGGVTDRRWFSTGRPPGHAYWARVWAARALLYVWKEHAAGAVLGALHDDEWRVREMAARVVARRQLAEAVERLVGLTGDATPRVRAAAVTALAVVGEGEHAAAVQALVADPDAGVARRADAALDAMGRRLDRPLRSAPGSGRARSRIGESARPEAASHPDR